MLEFTPVRKLAVIAYAIERVTKDDTKSRDVLTQAVKEVAIPAINNQFNTEGHGTWKPLSKLTVDRKGSTKILEETGKLHRAAVAFARWTIKNDRAEFTIGNSPTTYGLAHEKGFSKSPVRNYANLEEKDVDMIADLFGSKVEQNVVEQVDLNI